MMIVKAIAKRVKDIERIAAHYGFDNQANKTIEEMDELKHELDKMNDGMFPLSKIIGELADVMIMTTQIAMFIGPSLIDQEIDYKIDRQLRRMDTENTSRCESCNKYEPSDPNTVCHPCEWESQS